MAAEIDDSKVTESSIEPRIIGQDDVVVDKEVEEVFRVSVSMVWCGIISIKSIRDSKGGFQFHHRSRKKSDEN